MVKASVVVKNVERSPALVKEVKARCMLLKTFGYEQLKVEVHLNFSKGGYRAHVLVTGKNLSLNASERRSLPLEQALQITLTKIERQLAKSASKRTYRRPLLSRQAKLIQLNPSMESRQLQRAHRRHIKAA